jgi:hypothetical protein
MNRSNHSFEVVAKRVLNKGLKHNSATKTARIFAETKHIMTYTELIDNDFEQWSIKGYLMAWDCYGSVLGNDNMRRN